MNGWIEWFRMVPSLEKGQRLPAWRVLADALVGLVLCFLIFALDWIEAVAAAAEGDPTRLLLRVPVAVMFAGMFASARFMVHLREAWASRFRLGSLGRFGARTAVTLSFVAIWGALAYFALTAIRNAVTPLSSGVTPGETWVVWSVAAPLVIFGVGVMTYLQTRAEQRGRGSE